MKRETLIILIIFGVAALALTGGVVYMAARGIRNNNPGNIKKSGTKWLGLDSAQPDSTFYKFVSPEYGIRAMTLVLRTYFNKYGLNTIRGIINRWAPPSENVTSAYVNSVASRLGVAPDATIDVNARMPELIAAIIQHENGVQPYPVDIINKGISLA